MILYALRQDIEFEFDKIKFYVNEENRNTEFDKLLKELLDDKDLTIEYHTINYFPKRNGGGRILALRGYRGGDYHSTFHLNLYEDIIKTED
jgi:hypothetical protein